MIRTNVWMTLSIFAILLISGVPVLGQMPGMEPPPKREQATAQPTGTTEAVTTSGQAKEYPKVRFAVPASNVRYRLEESERTEQTSSPPYAATDRE